MPFTFSVFNDASAAAVALKALVAQATAAGDNGEAFELAFANALPGTSSTGQTYLKACDGDVIVGMLVIITDSGVTHPGISQLQCIITAPAYRRKGIATQLLQLAGQMAKENGKPIVTIHTAVQGHPAPFFTSAGFTVDSIAPGFASLPGERITDIVTYWKRY